MGVSASVPPQLRMFMRTTLHAGVPGARGNALDVARVGRALQPMHQNCTVSRWARSGSGCQWQWQSTRLPSAGSTSTVSATERSGNAGRGRKLPTMVCRWPLLSPRRGSNGGEPRGDGSAVGSMLQFHGFSGSRRLEPTGFITVALLARAGNLGRRVGIEPTTS